jgi:hypothetical protein
MKRGIPEGIFVVVAAVLLVLPVLQMLTGIVPVDAINEKRKRYEIPRLTERLLQLDQSLAADVNRWFDDRYGFRDLLIRAKNQVDYTLFRSSDKVAIGRNDWLFLRDHSQAMVAYEREGAAWRDMAAAKLGAIARYLAAQDIRFIVLRVAEKGDFHRERRPRDLPARPTLPQIDKLRAQLESVPDIVYMDASEIFARSGDQRSMYWRTDLHFNYRAAEILTRALVEKIAELEKQVTPAPPRKLEAAPLAIHGDLGPFIAKLTPVRETDYYFLNQFLVDQDTAEGSWTKDSVTIEVSGGATVPVFEYIFRSARGVGQAKLPVTVMFGNSFGDMFFGTGLQTYFTEFYRARNHPERFGKALQKLPPRTKYVIYQFFDPLFGAEFPLWDMTALEKELPPARMRTASPVNE